MKILSSKRRVAVAAALVLLALFLVRPGASRLKSRIIASLSAAVGRRVDIGSVHVQFLPRPGFDLENLVVYDDPEFGSEPMLRASEVTASLRVISLMRGRLEVARLDLTEPSLNLVHHVGGGWNLESLLEHTARTPLAPTGKTKSEPRPGFPYIEGASGRINFKNGPEKKPYALTNADFSLWQESENTWGVRLKAQPFRSDMNLNDMGLLQMNGTWQRAGSFRDTPLQFNVEWSQAQLGQVTKFFSGNDKGWRGEILFDAAITGTPGAVKFSSTLSADDFRRYDITSGGSLRLRGRCDGEYSTHDHEFNQISCSAPVGTGLLSMSGNAGLPGSHRYALVLTASDVPASGIGVLAQHLKKGIPEDLAVQGFVRGKVSISEDGKPGALPHYEGRAEIADLRASSASTHAELGPVTIPLILKPPVASGSDHKGRTQDQAQLEVGPFAMERGRADGAIVRGGITRSGYNFSISGEGEVSRTLHLARMFGLQALSSSAEGTAQLNLQLAGDWTKQGGTAGFNVPTITGTAKLRNVRFGLRGTGEPVAISSAEMLFAPDEVHLGKLTANAAGTVWKGSLEMPRGCGVPENCRIRFQLKADEVVLAQANEWATGSPKSRPWYRVLGAGQTSPSLLMRVRASGRLSADRFVLHDITASKVSIDISADAGKFEVSSIEGDLLGGKHRGRWLADFSIKPSVCSGKGAVTNISLADVSKLMRDHWIEGTASGTYDIRGGCASGFWQSSQGTLEVNMTNGSLPHVLLREGGEVLKIRRLTASARLNEGEIEISDGRLDAPEGKYSIRGTANFKREIEVKVTPVTGVAGTAYAIGGTLAEPQVSQITGTEQARLKAPAK